MTGIWKYECRKPAECGNGPNEIWIHIGFGDVWHNCTVILVATLTGSLITLSSTVWQCGFYSLKGQFIRTNHVLECDHASTFQSHESQDNLLWYQVAWIHVVCCLCNSISHCWTGCISAEFPLRVLLTSDGWSYVSLCISCSVEWFVESLLLFGMKLGFLYNIKYENVLSNTLGK